MTEIAQRARSIIGVPFLHQGRDENGMDCIGSLAHIVDYDFDKLPPYPRDPINGELETAMTAVLGPPIFIKPFAKENLREADIVALQYRGPIRHVGILLNHPTLKGELSLVHTDSMVGEVVEHILDIKWFRRIELVWRLESV